MYKIVFGIVEIVMLFYEMYYSNGSRLLIEFGKEDVTCHLLLSPIGVIL